MGILLQPYDFNVLARRIDMRLMLLRAGVDHLRQQGIKQGARWAPSSQTYAREVFNQSFRRIVETGEINTHHRNMYGDTCLHLTAHSSQPEARQIIAFALMNGMAPNQDNQAGQTPLMISALGNSLPNYKLLRDSILAEPFSTDLALRQMSRPDVLGLNVLDYAVLGGAHEIAQDLVLHGIRPPASTIARQLPPTAELALQILGPIHPLQTVLADMQQTDALTQRLLHPAPHAP